MRERIESKHVTKEIKSQMPVIPVEIVKERGCTFCPYYLGNYEKQPRCMMKTCAWDDENERFHPVLRELIPFYKEKMEKAEEKFLAMKKIYTTLLGMFADMLIICAPQIKKQNAVPVIEYRKRIWKMPYW